MSELEQLIARGKPGQFLCWNSGWWSWGVLLLEHWPHKKSPHRDWCLLLTPMLSLVCGIQFCEQNCTATLCFWVPHQILGDFRGRIGWASSPILWLPDLLDLFQPKARLGMLAVWGSALRAKSELLWQSNCIHPPSLPRRVLVLYPQLTCTCVYLLLFISSRLQPGKFWKEQFPYPGVEWMKHALGSWSALGKFISCMSMSPLWWWPQDWLCGGCNPCSSRSRAPVLPNRQMAPAGLKVICEAGKENMPRERRF